MRSAIASTITARARRRYSGRAFCANSAPICAPETEPISSSTASTISTALVVSACIIVVAMVTNRIWNSDVPTTTLALMPRM